MRRESLLAGELCHRRPRCRRKADEKRHRINLTLHLLHSLQHKPEQLEWWHMLYSWRRRLLGALWWKSTSRALLSPNGKLDRQTGLAFYGFAVHPDQKQECVPGKEAS